MNRHGFLFWTLLGLLLVSACSPLKSQYFQQQAGQQLAEVAHFTAQQDASQATSLLELLPDPDLKELINTALAANPSLQQTLLTLKILQTQVGQTRADQLPQLAANLSGSKEEDSQTGYTGSLTISWELDLWHKLADNTAAAQEDVIQQQALWQEARDTLVAEVMQAWLQLIALQKNIHIEEQLVSTLEKNETFILQRYRSGLGTLADLDSARSSTASARATLEEYRESLAQQQRTLQQLLGQAAQNQTEIAQQYPQVIPPLATLPEQTLERRPDLQAAYAAIKAAELRSKVAYKELLPTISLQAALTDVADSPRALLLGDPVWSLLGQLTAPLFQGGQLKAAAEVADLEAAQSYQAYRETLLQAVSDIENAIGQEKSLTAQQKHIEDALSASRSSLQQYQSSYRSGLSDILDLLSVQQQAFTLELQLNNLIFARLSNRITLGLALGLGVQS